MRSPGQARAVCCLFLVPWPFSRNICRCLGQSISKGHPISKSYVESALPALSRDIPEQCVLFSYRSTCALPFPQAPGPTRQSPPCPCSRCLISRKGSLLTSPVAKLSPPLNIPLKPYLLPRSWWFVSGVGPFASHTFKPNHLCTWCASSPESWYLSHGLPNFLSKNGFLL